MLAAAILALPALPTVHAIINGQNAEDALGELDASDGPVYTKSGANNSPNARGLNAPAALALDTLNHRLFAADYANHRVVVYDLDAGNNIASRVMARVLGQPDFNSRSPNAAQNGMNSPLGLAYDAAGVRLFVADSGNRRVLVYDAAALTNGENAVHVLGQPDFVSSASTLTRSGMDSPSGLAYDAAGSRLFVADSNNRRILVFDASSIADGEDAAHVLGQSDFISSGPVLSQSGLIVPQGLAYDAAGSRLFAADRGGNRVLVYDGAAIADGTNAANVLGQPDFVSGASTLTRAGMSLPIGLAYESTGSRLFVADYGNNRVLVFDAAAVADGENALRVLGQPDFTSNGSATTRNGMKSPIGLSHDGVGARLFATDYGSNRILVFDTSSLADGMDASDALGELDASDNPVYTKSGANDSPNNRGFSAPAAVALDAANHRLFAADYGNNRVVVYGLDAANAIASRVMTRVLGQPDLVSRSPATTRAKMSSPSALAYDAAGARLFVADGGNHRVLVFDVSSIADGMDAAGVLGQPGFTSSHSAVSRNGMDFPLGLAYDGAGSRLFVADGNNRRVLVFDVSAIADGEDAAHVLGQPDFTSNAQATTRAGMRSPYGLAYDAAGSRLFAAESSHRVLVYDVSAIADGEDAAHVLGQPDFTSNVPAAAQNGLSSPYGLAYDTAGARLFAADYGNNRVLAFDASSIADGMNASGVLGQPDFVSNAQAITRSGLKSPMGLAHDGSGPRVYASDGSNRILVYLDTPPPAPGSPALSGVFTSSVSLSWTSVGSNGYAVEACTAADYTGIRFSSATTDGGAGGLVVTLTPNTTFYLRAGALWGTATAYASSLSTATLAAEPTGAAFSSVGTSSITLQWSRNGNPEGVTLYTVLTSTAPDPAAPGGAAATSSDTFNAFLSTAGLNPGVAYFFKIRALSRGGLATPYTAAVSTETQAPAPGGPELSGVFVSSISVSWAPTDSEGYALEASTAADFTGTLFSSTTADGAALGLVVTLTPNTTYFMRVGALWGAVTSYASSLSTATLAAEPGGSAFSSIGTSSITLQWSRNGNPESATLYTVLTSTAPDPAAPGGAAATSSTTYNAFLSTTGLSADTPYFFRVRAIGHGGLATPYTAAASTRTHPPPPAAPAVSASAVSSGAIRWSWTASGGAAEQYLLFTASGALAASLPGASTHYLETALSSGTLYSRYLQASNVSGQACSSTVSAATPGLDSYASGTSSSSLTGADGKTRLEIPLGLLGAATSWMLSDAPTERPLMSGTPALIAAAAAPGGMRGSTSSLSEFIIQTEGVRSTATLALAVTVQVPYPDAGNTGFVDGTSPPIRADTLQLFVLNETTGLWEAVPGSTVDTANKVVRGPIRHLSIFTAFGVGAASSLSGLRVYPIPYRPNGGNQDEGRPYSPADPDSGIIFDNLPQSVRITVYTITGQKVASFASDRSNGKVRWDARNDDGQDVATGGYLAVIDSPGASKIVRKLLIVR